MDAVGDQIDATGASIAACCGRACTQQICLTIGALVAVLTCAQVLVGVLGKEDIAGAVVLAGIRVAGVGLVAYESAKVWRALAYGHCRPGLHAGAAVQARIWKANIY